MKELNGDWLSTPSTLEEALQVARRQEFAEAVKTLQMCIETFPKVIPAQLDLAELLQRAHKFHQSNALYDGVLANKPNHVRARILRANYFRATGQLDLAVDDLKHVKLLRPEHRKIYTKLALAYESQGNFDEALKMLDRNVELNASGSDAKLLRARIHFNKGNDKTASRLFKVAMDDPSTYLKAALAWARALMGDLRFEEAKDIVLCGIRKNPELVEWYLLAAKLINGDLGMDSELLLVLENAPCEIKETTRYQLGAKLLVCLVSFDIEAIQGIINQQNQAGLSETDGADLLKVMWRFSAIEDFVIRYKELNRRFPNRPVFQNQWLLMYHIYFPESIAAEKELILGELDEIARNILLCNMEKDLLSASERRVVNNILHAKSLSGSKASKRQLLQRYTFETDRQTIKIILTDKAVRSTLLTWMAPILEARISPVEHSEPGPKNYSKVCRSSLDRVSGNLDAPKYLAKSINTLSSTIQTSSRHWMDCGEDFAAADSLCDWILERIETKTPSSLVRLGDGEGKFLVYPPELKHLQVIDQMRVQRYPWWGVELISPVEAEKISAELIEVVKSADLIGIPQAMRILTNLNSHRAETNSDFRGIIGIFEFLSTLKIKGNIASCNFHVDFNNWNLYAKLLSKSKEISVISCHDHSKIMKNKFDVRVRSFHKIPGEYRYLDRSQNDWNARTPQIYPDTYSEVLENIDPSPGEVYFVGAGMLGKMYCQRIKELGGIGIDIGSQADYWANRNTRDYFSIKP